MFLAPFSDLQNFIILVRTVQFLRKIIFISSYTAENNYFLLYELIQDLPYYKYITEAIIIDLIQNIEADFPWKVSLKILKSGIILKTFTHVVVVGKGASNSNADNMSAAAVCKIKLITSPINP